MDYYLHSSKFIAIILLLVLGSSNATWSMEKGQGAAGATTKEPARSSPSAVKVQVAHGGEVQFKKTGGSAYIPLSLDLMNPEVLSASEQTQLAKELGVKDLKTFYLWAKNEGVTTLGRSHLLKYMQDKAEECELDPLTRLPIQQVKLFQDLIRFVNSSLPDLEVPLVELVSKLANHTPNTVQFKNLGQLDQMLKSSEVTEGRIARVKQTIQNLSDHQVDALLPIRELVANGLDSYYYDSRLTKKFPMSERQVQVRYQPSGTIEFEDHGLGMNLQSVLFYLLTPKRSKNNLILEGSQSQDITGRFGEGFFSALSFLKESGDQIEIDTKELSKDPVRVVLTLKNSEILVRFEKSQKESRGTAIRVHSQSLNSSKDPSLPEKIKRDVVTKYFENSRQGSVSYNGSSIQKNWEQDGIEVTIRPHESHSPTNRVIVQKSKSAFEHETLGKIKLTVNGILVSEFEQKGRNIYPELVIDFPLNTPLTQDRKTWNFSDPSTREAVLSIARNAIVQHDLALINSLYPLLGKNGYDLLSELNFAHLPHYVEAIVPADPELDNLQSLEKASDRKISRLHPQIFQMSGLLERLNNSIDSSQTHMIPSRFSKKEEKIKRVQSGADTLIFYDSTINLKSPSAPLKLSLINLGEKVRDQRWQEGEHRGIPESIIEKMEFSGTQSSHKSAPSDTGPAVSNRETLRQEMKLDRKKWLTSSSQSLTDSTFVDLLHLLSSKLDFPQSESPDLLNSYQSLRLALAIGCNYQYLCGTPPRFADPYGSPNLTGMGWNWGPSTGSVDLRSLLATDHSLSYSLAPWQVDYPHANSEIIGRLPVFCHSTLALRPPLTYPEQIGNSLSRTLSNLNAIYPLLQTHLPDYAQKAAQSCESTKFGNWAEVIHSLKDSFDNKDLAFVLTTQILEEGTPREQMPKLISQTRAVLEKHREPLTKSLLSAIFTFDKRNPHQIPAIVEACYLSKIDHCDQIILQHKTLLYSFWDRLKALTPEKKTQFFKMLPLIKIDETHLGEVLLDSFDNEPWYQFLEEEVLNLPNPSSIAKEILWLRKFSEKVCRSSIDAIDNYKRNLPIQKTLQKNCHSVMRNLLSRFYSGSVSSDEFESMEANLRKAPYHGFGQYGSPRQTSLNDIYHLLIKAGILNSQSIDYIYPFVFGDQVKFKATHTEFLGDVLSRTHADSSLSEHPKIKEYLEEDPEQNQKAFLVASQQNSRPYVWLKEVIKNAREAQAKNLDITVRTDSQDQLVVDIKDDGKGVRPEEMAAFFTPGYSTKKARGNDRNFGWGLFTLFAHFDELVIQSSADGITRSIVKIQKKGNHFRITETSEPIARHGEHESPSIGTTLSLRKTGLSKASDPVTIKAQTIKYAQGLGASLNLTFNQEKLEQLSQTRFDSQSLLARHPLLEFPGNSDSFIEVASSEDTGLYYNGLMHSSSLSPYTRTLPDFAKKEIAKLPHSFAVNLKADLKQNMNRNSFDRESELNPQIERALNEAQIKAIVHQISRNPQLYIDLFPYDFFHDFRGPSLSVLQTEAQVRTQPGKPLFQVLRGRDQMGAYISTLPLVEGKDWTLQSLKKRVGEVLKIIEAKEKEDSKNGEKELESIPWPLFQSYFSGEPELTPLLGVFLNHINMNRMTMKLPPFIEFTKDFSKYLSPISKDSASLTTPKDPAKEKKPSFAPAHFSQVPVEWHSEQETMKKFESFVSLLSKEFLSAGTSETSLARILGVKFYADYANGNQLGKAIPGDTSISIHILQKTYLDFRQMLHSGKWDKQAFLDLVDTLTHEMVHLEEHSYEGTHNDHFFEKQKVLIEKFTGMTDHQYKMLQEFIEEVPTSR